MSAGTPCLHYCLQTLEKFICSVAAADEINTFYRTASNLAPLSIETAELLRLAWSRPLALYLLPSLAAVHILSKLIYNRGKRSSISKDTATHSNFEYQLEDFVKNVVHFSTELEYESQ